MQSSMQQSTQPKILLSMQSSSQTNTNQNGDFLFNQHAVHAYFQKTKNSRKLLNLNFWNINLIFEMTWNINQIFEMTSNISLIFGIIDINLILGIIDISSILETRLDQIVMKRKMTDMILNFRMLKNSRNSIMKIFINSSPHLIRLLNRCINQYIHFHLKLLCDPIHFKFNQLGNQYFNDRIRLQISQFLRFKTPHFTAQQTNQASCLRPVNRNTYRSLLPHLHPPTCLQLAMHLPTYLSMHLAMHLSMHPPMHPQLPTHQDQ